MAAIIAPLIVGAGASASALAAATLGVNIALYAGTTALSYFLSQPERTASATRGSNLTVALGGAVSQKVLFGRIETNGHLSYAGTFGRSSAWPNNYAVRQYILSDFPIDGGVGIWYAGRRCEVDWGSPFVLDGNVIGYPITTFRKGGVDYKWVKILTGGQNAADPFLRAKFGGATTRPYGAARVGFGRAIAVLTERYDKKKYTSLGEPRFVVDAMKCYDPRKDSTNGGSGSHRWGTPSTHEHTTNLAVIYYNIRRGLYYDGERLFGGRNYPAYMLDNDSYFAAMNACNENVTLKAGGTEKRYAGGGEIDISGRVTEVLDRLLTCMNGRVVEAGGISRLYVGGVGANVLSITDDDIVITEPEDGEEGPDPDEIFNTVTGVYTEPGDAGEPTSFRKKTNSTALARDGEELPRQLDQIYCRSNSQAQRVAKAALEEGQRWIKRGIVLPPWARVLKPTNCIGWSAKKFIVGDVTPMRNGNVHVKLREANASDSDWTTADEDDWDVGGYEDETLAAEDFTAAISAVSITDDDGTGRRPGLLFEPSSAVLSGGTWADVKADYENARALLFKVRKKNGSQKVIVPDGRIDDFFEDGTAEFTHSAFLPGLQVQVRTRVELIGGALTDWSGWTNVTLTNARLKTSDIADDAVEAANIKNNAVTNTKINDNAVSTTKIADEAVRTAKVGKGQISVSDQNSGSAKFRFTDTSSHSGTEYVITSGADNWAFEIDADGGANLFIDIEIAISAYVEYNEGGAQNPSDSNIASGNLVLYRKDQSGDQKTLRTWSINTSTKKKSFDGDTYSVGLSKLDQQTVMAGKLDDANGKCRVFLALNWYCRRQSGSSGECFVAVPRARMAISYNRR